LNNNSINIGKNTIYKISSTSFNEFSAQLIENNLESLCKEKEVVNIALSGGSTPLPILNILKDKKLNWRKFNFFLVDERVVESSSNESNFKNISHVFFQYISSQSFPFLKESMDLEKMIVNYRNEIKKHVVFDASGFPKFDLILLGMGSDGHTASLFPETSALNEKEAFYVKNYVSELNSYRVTLTYPVLLNSLRTFVFIKGEEKLSIFQKIMNGNEEKYPISKLQNINLNWIIGV